MSKNDTKAVVEKKDHLPAEVSSFLGEQMEGADSESFAVPFLVLLQSGSPQVKKSNSQYIEGAEEGGFMNTVSETLLMDGFEFIQVAFKRQMLEWIQRKDGGGLVEIHTVEKCPKYEKIVTDEGKKLWLMENGHEIVDTRSHFILYKTPAGYWSPAVIALAKTQVKRSKKLMFILDEQKELKNVVTMKAGSMGDNNSEHSWTTWTFKIANHVNDDAELMKQAIEFQKSLSSGEAQVDKDAFEKASGSTESDNGPNDF